MERVRKALGLAKLIPAGHSWGGLLAYEYTLKYPENVAALILVSPCLSAARWKEDTDLLITGLPDYVQSLIRDGEMKGAFTDPGYQHANDVFKSKHLFCKGDQPPHLAKSFKVFNEAIYNFMWGPSEFTARGTFKDYDGTGRLGEVSVPTLFVCGEHDEARPETMRRFADQMGDASVVVIDDTAHMSFVEDEAAFVAEVGAFLERHFP